VVELFSLAELHARAGNTAPNTPAAGGGSTAMRFAHCLFDAKHISDLAGMQRRFVESTLAYVRCVAAC